MDTLLTLLSALLMSAACFAGAWCGPPAGPCIEHAIEVPGVHSLVIDHTRPLHIEWCDGPPGDCP